jgi:hypothetical protein
VTSSSDNSIESLEDQLEGVVLTLSRMGVLSQNEAERVAQRIDRLASQLLEVSAPPAITAVHERLGTTPAGRAEFLSLVEQMGPADGEG